MVVARKIATRSYKDVHIPCHNDLMMKRIHAPPPHQPTFLDWFSFHAQSTKFMYLELNMKKR
jgi:hypothetical protein